MFLKKNNIKKDENYEEKIILHSSIGMNASI